MLKPIITTKDTNGNVIEVINPLKAFFNSSWLFCTPVNPIADPGIILAAAGAPGSVVSRTLQCFQDSHAKIDRFADNGFALNNALNMNYTLEIQHLYDRRQLTNGPIHARTIVGSGQRPFVLPEEIFLPASNSLQFTFANLAAAPFTTRFAGISTRMYHVEAERGGLQPPAIGRPTNVAFLTSRVTPIAVAGGVGAFTDTFIDVPEDAEFMVEKITHFETTAPALEFLYIITDPATGRMWSNGPVHSEVGSGNGEFPFKLPEPTIVGRRNSIPLRIINIQGAALTVYFTLTGRFLRYQRG